MVRCRRLGLAIDPRRVGVENSGSRRDSTALVSGARPLRPEAAASRCYESWSPYGDLSPGSWIGGGGSGWSGLYYRSMERDDAYWKKTRSRLGMIKRQRSLGGLVG